MLRPALFAVLSLVLAFQAGCAAHAPDLPIPITNNAVTSVIHPDGAWSVYCFMGITDPTDPQTITPASFRLDSGTRAWIRIGDAPLDGGRARIGASAVTVAGRVYLLGGYSVLDDGHEVTEKRLLRYDPDADAYAELASVPVEVDDTLAGVYADRYIVLISGWHGPSNDNVSDVQLYDTRRDVWASATPLPGRPLFGHSGGVSGETIVVMDGVARGKDGFEMSSAVQVGRINPADPTRIVWEQRDAHEGRATYRAACSTTGANDGAILALGGSDTAYNISGTGYNGEACAPLEQLLVVDAGSGGVRVGALPVGVTASMDHRGLVPIGDGRWMVVGGMVGPGRATDRVQIMRIAR